VPKLSRPWRRRLDWITPPDLMYLAEPKETGESKTETQRTMTRQGSPRGSSNRTERPVPKIVTVLAEPGEVITAAATRNYNKAFYLEELKRKRITATFALLVAKIAEDLSGWPILGDDEWNAADLMARHLDRRALSHCRRSREKEAVVVILDTSGSCLAQARFYSRIATAAVAAGDVELYDAPNAGLRAVRNRDGWKAIEDTEWDFSQRTIIFFGDFDGGDAVITASRRNKIYWFCSETRYPSIRLHPWCSLSMSAFKGRYYPCTTDEDFIPLLRKVR